MVMHLLFGRSRHIAMHGRHVLPNKHGGSVIMLDKEISLPVVGHAFREVGRDMLGRDGRGQREKGKGISPVPVSHVVVSKKRPLVFRG